jgi:hypothetical protein
MATVLLAARDVGLLVLPLMLYHILQLMTCATLARRWQPIPAAPAPAPTGPQPRTDPPPPATVPATTDPS